MPSVRRQLVLTAVVTTALVSMAAAEELRLVFAVQETRSAPAAASMPAAASQPAEARPDTTRPSAAAMPTSLPAQSPTMTVCLGKDYMTVQQAGQKTVYDFSKKRIYTLDLGRKSYTDAPMHTVVARRAAEFVAHLPPADAADKTAGADPFDLRMAFAIELPDAKRAPDRDAYVPLPQAPAVRFQYRNQDAVRFVASERPVPPAYKAMFSRFLVYQAPMHPAIRGDIEKTGKLPQMLSIRYSAGELAGKDFELRSSVLDPKGKYDAPGGRLVRGEGELGRMLNSVYSQDVPLPDVQEVIRAAQDAVMETDRPVLDAVLTLAEFTCQTGGEIPDVAKALEPVTRNDLQYRLFTAATNSRDKESAKAALASLDQIDASKLKKAYMLEFFKANAKAQAGELEEARKMLLRFLAPRIGMTGGWVSLGGVYFQELRMESAWLCWEAAAKIFPRMPLLANVRQLEQSLEKDHPEYFN